MSEVYLGISNFDGKESLRCLLVGATVKIAQASVDIELGCALQTNESE